MKVLIITGDKNFIPGHPRFDLQASHVENLSAIFWGRGSIKPKLPEEKFDVITSQDPFWRGLFAWRTARHIGAKLNIQVHTDLSAQSLFRRTLARIILRRADSVRVVSEKLRQQVLDMGVKRSIHVLPVFVDLSKFRNMVRRKHSTPNILWLGRYEKEKNPLGAISVLEKVRDAGVDARLVMLGEGSMTPEVTKKADNLPFVQVLTWQNPITYFEVADVVLCTSKHESWGASMIEALAAGIPVVAPNVGVAKEAGAHVVPRDTLAEGVINALKSGAEGKLQLQLVEEPDEWGKAWKKTLL